MGKYKKIKIEMSSAGDDNILLVTGISESLLNEILELLMIESKYTGCPYCGIVYTKGTPHICANSIQAGFTECVCISCGSSDNHTDVVDGQPTGYRVCNNCGVRFKDS